MAKALAVDLRRPVVDAVEAGASCRQAAARFGVGVSSAVRWVTRTRTLGDLEPDKRGGNHRSHRIDEHRELIFGWIAEEPDLTLAEVAERLAQAVGYGSARYRSSRSKYPGSPDIRASLTDQRHRISKPPETQGS
ncbi:MAG: IS630 transposase-related protein [Pseudomonadota bacterium]